MLNNLLIGTWQLTSVKDGDFNSARMYIRFGQARLTITIFHDYGKVTQDDSSLWYLKDDVIYITTMSSKKREFFRIEKLSTTELIGIDLFEPTKHMTGRLGFTRVAHEAEDKRKIPDVYLEGRPLRDLAVSGNRA